MKVLRKSLYLLRIFLWPIYFLSGLFKRDENIILFGSLNGTRFADNPKYLFLYLNAFHKGKRRYIWISRVKKIVTLLQKKGFESYYLYSLKGIYFLLRSKYYVYDHHTSDIFFWMSRGCEKINLWHGIPLKKIENDMGVYSKYFCASTLKKYIYKIVGPWIYESHDFVLTTSKFLVPIFRSAFKINSKKIIISNYPRNIALLKSFNGEEIGLSIQNFYTIKEKKQNSFKIVFYLPTFRDNTEDNFYKIIDFDLLKKFCKKNKIIFLMKPHPLAKFNSNFLENEFIFLLNKYEDIYPYLRLSDILITDYSSVFFDYYLTKRPVIFFPYDLDEYLSKNRQMYFKYNDVCIGWKAYNFKELLICIENALNSPNFYRNEVEKNLCLFFEKNKDPENIEEILRILKIENSCG